MFFLPSWWAAYNFERTSVAYEEDKQNGIIYTYEQLTMYTIN